MDRRIFGASRGRSTRRSPRRAALATALAAVLTLGTPALVAAPAQAVKTQTQIQTRSSATALAPEIYEARVQRMVNRRRANHGLPRLRMSACADRSAERWSRHLAARSAFYHQSMWDVLERCNARYAGETLGRGSMRPARLVRMWMQSPGHRAVLLSGKARRIGVGMSTESSGRIVVAANFVRY